MFGNPSYPSYQVFLAAAIAALVTMVLMPLFIKMMRHEGVGQQIRADGPEQHLIKQGTPTMGGVRSTSSSRSRPRWPPARWACSTT